jgi:hypothetical protein
LLFNGRHNRQPLTLKNSLFLTLFILLKAKIYEWLVVGHGQFHGAGQKDN